jgi:hypothetical protein
MSEPAGPEKPAGTSVVERLAGRGEETLRRLLAELDRNPRLTGARGRLERVERSVLNRLGIASVEEVDELRRQVARLEEQLGPSAGSPPPSAPTSADE